MSQELLQDFKFDNQQVGFNDTAGTKFSELDFNNDNPQPFQGFNDQDFVEQDSLEDLFREGEAKVQLKPNPEKSVIESESDF